MAKRPDQYIQVQKIEPMINFEMTLGQKLENEHETTLASE